MKEHSETLLFYEAPHHLRATLAELAAALGAGRKAVAARELTKKFEEFRRGTLQELQDYFSVQEPRGEFVLLVAGNDGCQQAAPDVYAGLGPAALVARLVADKDGQVAGFAYANWFKPRPAYRFSAEDSIYVADHAQGMGLGRMLLAGLPDAELQARLQGHPMQRFTEHTTTDVDALLAHIRQARQQGWCLVNQELEEGLISIAAPLTNRTGQTVAALNISGQANRTSAAMMQESLLPALQSAARTISRMMGAPRG